MKKRPIVWMEEAREDIDEAFAYLCEQNPKAAVELYKRIHEKAGILSDFPGTGRVGRVSGTRELLISGTHYLLAYEVIGKPEQVVILRVLHDSRQWPEAMK